MLLRGIDVPNVEVVVNYDVPQNLDTMFIELEELVGQAYRICIYLCLQVKEIYSLRTIKKVKPNLKSTKKKVHHIKKWKILKILS